MFDSSDDAPHVAITLDERAIKALDSSVACTLEKWAGQGEMDQEELFALKPCLQGCLLEFQFHR